MAWQECYGLTGCVAARTARQDWRDQVSRVHARHGKERPVIAGEAEHDPAGRGLFQLVRVWFGRLGRYGPGKSGRGLARRD